MADMRVMEKAQGELGFRLDGLEWALDESVPTLVGAVVLHLARKGVLNLAELESDLRGDLIENPRLRDSTDTLFSTLASLLACYRGDGSGKAVSDTARYSPVYEKVGPPPGDRAADIVPARTDGSTSTD